LVNFRGVRSRSTGLVLAAGAAVTVLLLTGCVDQKPSPTHTANSGGTSGASTPTPTQTASVAPPTPVTIACAKVLTLQQVYDYNPNYVQAASYKPGAGTPGAQVAADQGQVCGWLNETSGVKLEVAIAHPASSELGTLRSGATGSSVQLGGGAVGYFQVAGGVGRMQIFSGVYWIVISSADIASEGDVDPIATDVLGNLGAA
jgi:hypothetical protein